MTKLRTTARNRRGFWRPGKAARFRNRYICWCFPLARSSDNTSNVVYAQTLGEIFETRFFYSEVLNLALKRGARGYSILGPRISTDSQRLQLLHGVFTKQLLMKEICKLLTPHRS